MRFEAIVITSLNTRQRVAARKFGCDCESDQFLIYQIVGQDHPHYQCVDCGASYCSSTSTCHNTIDGSHQDQQQPSKPNQPGREPPHEEPEQQRPESS